MQLLSKCSVKTFKCRVRCEGVKFHKVSVFSSIRFLSNLSQATKGILINPQRFWFIIINLLVLFDADLHAREHGGAVVAGAEHGRGVRHGRAEHGAGDVTRRHARLGAVAGAAVAVRGVLAAGPLLAVRVVREHGLDVEPLHPVPQRPRGDVVLHARPVDGLPVHDLLQRGLETVLGVLLVPPHGRRADHGLGVGRTFCT